MEETNTQAAATTTDTPPQPNPPKNYIVSYFKKKYYPNKSDEDIHKSIYQSKETFDRATNRIYTDQFEGRMSKEEFDRVVDSSYGNPFKQPTLKKKAVPAANGSKPSSDGSDVESPDPFYSQSPEQVNATISSYLKGLKGIQQDATRYTPAPTLSRAGVAVSDEKKRLEQEKQDSINSTVEQTDYRKKHGDFWGGVNFGAKWATSMVLKGGAAAVRGVEATRQMVDKGIQLIDPTLTDAEVKRVADKNNASLDKIDKAADLGIEDKLKPDEHYNPGGIQGAIGGVLQTVPAILASEGTGGASWFFNGVGNADKQVNELKAKGVKFDHHTDDLFRVGSGIISYGLTKLDVFPLLANAPTALKNDVIGSLSADGIRNLGTNLDNVTSQDVVNAFMKPLMTVSERIKQFGGEFGKTYAHNAGVLSALNVADYGLKAGINSANKKAPFKQNTQELFDTIAKTLTLDAPVFSVMGAASKMGMLFKNSPYENSVVNDLRNDSSPENIANIKQTLSNIAANKEWNRNDVQNTMNAVDLIADVANKVPKNIPPENFHQAVGLILNRREMEKILNSTKNKTNLDPAIVGKETAYEIFLKAKIEQANDKLAEQVTGKKYEYFEKDGKYYKQVPNEESEEISKYRFYFENHENSFKQPAEETVVPGGPPMTVASAGKTRSLNDEDVDYLKANGSDAIKAAISEKEDNVTLNVHNNETADEIMAVLDKRDELAKEAAKAKPSTPKAAEPVETPAPKTEAVEAPKSAAQEVADALDRLKQPINEKTIEAAGTTAETIETAKPVKPAASEETVTPTDEKPKSDQVEPVVAKTETTELSPARKKAIDAVTHGIIVPDQVMENDPSGRFDLGMTTAEKKKALRDIHAGKFNTAPAKKLLDKVEEFEKNNDYPIIEGLGGSATRSRGATSAEIQQSIDEAKMFKLNPNLNAQDIEHNKALFNELGITHNDIENYENYRRETEPGDNGRAAGSIPENVQRTEDDQTTSAAQTTGDTGTQAEPAAGVDKYFIAKRDGFEEVEGTPVPNNHGLDLFVHGDGDTFNVTEGSTGLRMGTGLTKKDAIANAMSNIESKSSGEIQATIKNKYEGGLQSPRGIRTQDVAANIDNLSAQDKTEATEALATEGLTLKDIQDYERSTGLTENNAENLQQPANDGATDAVQTGTDQAVQTRATGNKAEREATQPDGTLDQNAAIRNNAANTELSPEGNYIDRIADAITNSDKLNIVSLRKLATELGIDGDDIKLQDLAETAVVRLANDVALNPELTDQEKLDKIVDIYNRQPAFNQRSSDRIALQQYSTPAPTSFIGGLYGKAINPARVFEPSAGNGLLTVAFKPKTVSVNEIDKNRIANLNRQGFGQVSAQDATHSFGETRSKDFVISNPPFGKAPEKSYDGYRIAGLDEQMIINALNEMKDTGRGVFIMGGHNKYDAAKRLASDRTFFNYLYSHYNVSDVINVDGSLYQKQGTTFPIRMILINGRKAEVGGVSPLKDEVANKPVSSFQELFDRVQNKILNDENKNLLQSGMDAERNTMPLVYGADTFIGEPKTTSGIDTVSGIENSPAYRRIDKPGGERSELDRGQDRAAGISNNTDRGSEGVTTERELSALPGRDGSISNGESAASTRDNSAGSDAGIRPNRPEQDTRQSAGELVEKEKIPYAPTSGAQAVGSVIPSNMASEARRVLKNIENEHGNIDVFVSSRLGYPSMDALYNAFSAEQIDALAMGIQQMEAGQGMIIGDMTGVGKGRIAAGMIRYGIKRGKTPVFLTEKATLFSDLYRDLVDIGSSQYVPFIVNDKSSDNDPTITDANGVVVHKVPATPVKNKALKDSQLPNGYDFVMATYSQFTSSKPSDKKTFLQSVSIGQPVVMDESHNVSGTSNSGAFFQEILGNVQGVMYLSATFAKRPDNMPVYALKTAMQEANMTNDELVAAITHGGVALQEIVSAQWVECGQMLRRERDFTGVKNNFIELNSLAKDHRSTADSVTDIVRDIIAFQRDHINDMIESMDNDIAEAGGRVEKRRGTVNAGVDNTPYASKVFNVIDQMLFAIKAEAVADRAIAHLKENKKPVIAFKSTMESFLKNSNIEVGDTIEKPNFALSLLRGLKSAMAYTETNDRGDKIKKDLSINDLSPEGQDAYHAIEDKINKSSVGISISPIDVIIKKIKDAGYTVGEITGRKMQLEFQPDGSAKVMARDDRDIKKIVRQFNNGEGIDVILLNASGATGLSMHASAKFKDQRQRAMISHQLELDINKEIQKRGRIDRSGQVERGLYDTVFSSIPAEQRLAMMFKTKLKSLDANTTSSQKSKSSEEINDFLNKYGDRTVVAYLKEHPDVNEALLDPFKMNDMDVAAKDRFATIEGAASKVTGRVAILPSDQQEAFYKEITRRYQDLIQYLEDTNQNDLEVKSLPLEAETVSKKPYILGKGGTTPFGQDSMVETVKSNILKKPLSKDELEKEISQNLDGETTTQKQRMLSRDLADYYDQRIKEMREFVRENYARKREKASEKKYKNTDELSGQLQTLKELEAFDLNQKVNDLEKSANNVDRVFQAFRVGEEYDVPNSISTTGTKYSRGVFIGFEMGNATANPFAPSNIKMRFAVLDGRRVVAVPLSQNDFVNATLAGKQQRRAGMTADLRSEWGKVRSDNVKETRHIITGNILQAYTGHGQLVAYTTSDNQLKKGILMPPDFSPEKQLTVPATRASKALLTMPVLDKLITTDNTIGIQKLRGSRFLIEVSASKSVGGDYFLDADLRSVVDGNNFNTSGGKMVGEFDQVKLPKVLIILQSKFNKSFKIDEDEVFEEPAPDAQGKTAKDYIFDQTNVKPMLDFLENLKIKGGRMLSSLVPIPPAVFNKAIDVIKSIVIVTNSAQKAVRVAVRYLKDNGATPEQVSSFVQSMQDLFENTPSVKKMFEDQQKAEDRKVNMQNVLNTTIAEAQQMVETGTLTESDIKGFRTKLTEVLSEARKLQMIKTGESDANKANDAISSVNAINRNNPDSLMQAISAVQGFLNNVGDKGMLKKAMSARAQLRPFLNKKDSPLPATMFKDLVRISPDALTPGELEEYAEITGTLAEQLNGDLPGLVPNERIIQFTDAIKRAQEERLKARLIKKYAQLGATDAMSIDELTDIKNAAAKLNEDDLQEPVERVNKKRAVLDMFIDDARELVRKNMDRVEPEYRPMVDAMLGLSTDGLSTGEMKLYNQVLNNVAINNDYQGVGLFSKYAEADKDMAAFKEYSAKYQSQFRQISFGEFGKDLVKGSNLSKLSLSDKFFHLNSEREVGNKLDSVMGLPINQGYQKQQQQKAQLSEGFRSIVKKNKLERENMFRVGVFSDLNEHDLSMGTTKQEQFTDGVERLRQAVDRLRPFKTKYENTMSTTLSDIYDQVKTAGNVDDLSHFLTPEERELYDYTQDSWKSTYPKLKENTDLYSFDELGSIDNYAHRKYYNVGGKIDVNLVDDDNIDVRTGSTTREAKTKVGRTVRRTLPEGKIIDYNVFNSFNKGMNETLNDIHTLGARIKANRMLKSKELPGIIDISDRYKKTNTQILTDGIKLMVNVQRGIAKSDSDLYGSGQKLTSWVRQAFYTHTTGAALSGIPQYASSVAFVLPQLENKGAFWKSFGMFVGGAVGGDKEFRDMGRELMQKVGGGTINRDLQGDQELSEQLNHAAESLFGQYATQNLSDMVQKLQDAYFYSLKLGDRSIALHAWMAGYINSLIKQHVIGSSKEFTKDFLRDHLKEPNQMAAAEAEALVTISNNESDSSRRPETFVNKTYKQEFVNDILYPLKKFAVSMYNKMMLGVRNISEQNGGEIDGAKLILGAVASSVVFNTISQFVLGKSYDEGADLVMKVIGEWDNEEAMLDRKGMTREQVDQQKFEQKKLNLVTSTVADLFLNGHSVIVENGVKAATNLVYQNIVDNDSAKSDEVDEWGKPVKKKDYGPKQLFYSGNNLSEMMGIYSDTPVGVLFDIPLDKHNPYNVMQEQFKYQGWEGLLSKRVLFAVGVPSLSATGLLPADATRVNNRVKNRMEKLYQIEKEFKIKYMNKDNPDLQKPVDDE